MSTPAIISVAGRRTRVRVEGDPASPPMLLLHGVSRSLEDWALQYARLSRTHRVIALDLPGSGFSARSPESTTLEVLARGVLETLDSLGEERPVHLIGNSLGGAVAMQMVASAPERVASMVLVNSAAFGSEVALPLRLLTVPILGELALRRPTRRSALMSERLNFADSRLANAARIDHALAIADQPDTGSVLLETIRALATARAIKPNWRRHLIAAAANHPRPTLVIWGDQDRVLPAHHLDAARRAFPHAETELFAGIGHMPQIECPDLFATRVLTFVQKAVHERAAAPVETSARTKPRRDRARRITATTHA